MFIFEIFITLGHNSGETIINLKQQLLTYFWHIFLCEVSKPGDGFSKFQNKDTTVKIVLLLRDTLHTELIPVQSTQITFLLSLHLCREIRQNQLKAGKYIFTSCRIVLVNNFLAHIDYSQNPMTSFIVDGKEYQVFGENVHLFGPSMDTLIPTL